MTVLLKKLKPFGVGGNRWCFMHPDNPNYCIKVRRPDFTLEDLRRKKGFPKSLRPLSWFDDNLEEYKVLKGFEKTLGEPVFELVSRCIGFEDTDLGKGLTSELIRDSNGQISHTLKQYLWEHGLTPSLTEALSRFKTSWQTLAVPSRDLLTHNILVQRDDNDNIKRLVVIDGLGSSSAIPDWLLPRGAIRARAKRKVSNLQARIDSILEARAQNETPSQLGFLLHNGTPAESDTNNHKEPPL